MLLRLTVLTLLTIALSGCRFSREIVNPYVRDLDVSWIRPGTTTREEIVRKMGMPPTVRGLGGVTKDSFRWSSIDTFSRSFEGGYIVTPTFESANEAFDDDILIRFDEKGIVVLVSRTQTRGGETRLVDWREAPK